MSQKTQRSTRQRIRRSLAELLLFVALRAALPAVIAMSQIERRELERPPIVQTIGIRERRRALERRYGRLDAHFMNGVAFSYQYS